MTAFPLPLTEMLGHYGAFVVYFIIGISFGAVLEMAGFGNSRKLAAQFYFQDMTVLKVMFTGIIVAMVLVFGATAIGLLDYNLLWVNPTYLYPGIVGGLIMGAGFIIGGFCPGTSLVAAATLKKDGVMFVLGVLAGIFLFGETKLVTKGDFDVVSITCIDPKGGYVYYIASPDNPTERYLYRSPLNGKGAAERVSPENMPGQHSYQMSANARWAIHTFQNVITPNQYSLVSLPGHKIFRVLEDNAGAKAWFEAMDLQPKEFFRVDIGAADLNGWMIKPSGFDPDRKYPVIIHIYGEPHSSTVHNRWGGGDLWHQYLARQGYVVMSLDPRGTRMPRGREWRKVIYGKIGIVATHDHAAGMKEVLKKYPSMDPERVGIWGWSGGGQMTLNCMFHYPEIYRTGIAVAFVSDQRLYNTIYQERYMGLPSENTYGFREGSPLYHAHKLEGNLLIMHGTADDNVHYQSFEMLVDELVRHNKMFEMMSYPMRSHGIRERENTTYHLRQVMVNFWLENLPAGPR